MEILVLQDVHSHLEQIGSFHLSYLAEVQYASQCGHSGITVKSVCGWELAELQTAVRRSLIT